MKKPFWLFIAALVISSLALLISCKKKDPVPENIPELITRATITFTPSGGSSGSSVIVTATDPDNIGAQDIKVDGPINLAKGTTYTLTIQLVNGLYKPTDSGYNVSKQVEAEGDAHQFFFSWNTGLFSNPSGDGNIDNRNDPVNYGVSVDKNGRPVGLITMWTTASTPSSGSNSFRVLLKHQPGIKSNVSTSADGESDFDLTFMINVN